jgi:hypothetical protein
MRDVKSLDSGAVHVRRSDDFFLCNTPFVCLSHLNFYINFYHLLYKKLNII